MYLEINVTRGKLIEVIKYGVKFRVNVRKTH
jgi:hypothetical protein